MQKKSMVYAPVVAALVACGGGGGGGDPGAGSASTPAPAIVATATVCGYTVGPSVISGTVVNVHDGDTITVNVGGTDVQVRLDGIDAPELAQPYGSDSEAALASAVDGKSVRIAYSKHDQYGRIVGSVFTDSCDYANLVQVTRGMAWFYKAYQCELSAGTRTAFANAQQVASQAQLGLWSQPDPEAPWFYRNGREPITPTCTSNVPEFSGTYAMPDITTTPAGSSTSATGTATTSTGTGTSPDKTCYVGPRGGTYTLTSSGKKNYSGC